MKNIRNTLLATVGTAGLAGLAFWLAVINYDTPKYDAEKMENAKDYLARTEIKYENAQRRAIVNSADTLSMDKQYMSAVDDRENTFQKIRTGNHETVNKLSPKYKKMVQQTDSMAEALQEEYINKNQALIEATENMKAAQEHIAQLQRDSVMAREIAKLPLSVRFDTNWRKIRQDYHNARIAKHTMKLNNLQNEH